MRIDRPSVVCKCQCLLLLLWTNAAQHHIVFWYGKDAETSVRYHKIYTSAIPALSFSKPAELLFWSEVWGFEWTVLFVHVFVCNFWYLLERKFKSEQNSIGPYGLAEERNEQLKMDQMQPNVCKNFGSRELFACFVMRILFAWDGKLTVSFTLSFSHFEPILVRIMYVLDILKLTLNLTIWIWITCLIVTTMVVFYPFYIRITEMYHIRTEKWNLNFVACWMPEEKLLWRLERSKCIEYLKKRFYSRNEHFMRR